ncbi:aspartate aminotransferase family protein [Candidatus Bathyarchaeota archaeon]|nr:aspartate aminotransferase family protein [Candidatus Bathyarchaeota archaeon]
MLNYEEKTKKSKALYERAQHVLPGGVTYSIRAIPPYPFYVKKAEGVKLLDVDNNVYTDYWVGHGALILGHSPKRIVERVKKQLPLGTHYGFSHELEIELAEKICTMVPSAEMVRYTSSGTEANLYTVRLARTYTGRKKIIKMEGGWHGAYDPLHKAVNYPFTNLESAGIDPKVLESTITIPFNNLEAAKKTLSDKDIAALIVEPVQGVAGFVMPEPEYLLGLKELCNINGTLLVFDEVITGFRLAPGGAQEFFNVKPDITVLGKIVGGGFPIGAMVGRRDIFERIDHTKYPLSDQRSAQGGTFTGNPISMVAGSETLDILKGGRIHKKISKIGDKIRNGLEDIISRNKIPATVTGVTTIFAIHFTNKKPLNALESAQTDMKTTKAFFSNMLENGIAYLSPTNCHAMLAEPHTEEDAEKFLKVSEEFFKKYEPK